jgi:ribonuclease R
MGRDAASGASRTVEVMEDIHGTLRCHVRGFGFIERPHSPDGSRQLDEDLFVPAPKIGDARDGDTVAARVRTRTQGRRTTYDVTHLTVVRRGRSRLVGTMRDATTLALDPGLGLGTLRTIERAQVGHAVIVEGTAKGWRVVEDLGPELDDESLTRRFLERHLLPHTHEPATIEEARRTAARAKPGRRAGRRDLRERLVVTIDADHSRDLDDAVSAERLADGTVRVWVHIADVAEHVVPGSAVDRAARTIPTSVYLPTMVRPMLPEVLSESALSLVPGVDRDTLTVEMRIGPDGAVTEVEIYESVIRSRRRLSYITVAGCLRGDRAAGNQVEPEVHTLIGDLYDAARLLGVERERRGGVDSDRFDGGEDDDAKDAHLLIERLMVATNEAVATWMANRDLPAIHRCHLPPDDEGLTGIETSAKAFGHTVSFPRPCTPAAFGSFSTRIADSCHADALWDVIGGTLNRATYEVGNAGHFGLGSERYLHFTSPLRRYADLIVHRIVKASLRGRAENWDLTALQTLAAHITDVSDRAGRAERDANCSLTLRDLQRNGRRQAVGTVRSVGVKQLKVHAPDLAATYGTVSVRKLGRGYRVDEVRRELRGTGPRITAGSNLRVRVTHIDPITGALELSVVGDPLAPTS